MFVDSVETNKHIFSFFHHRVAKPCNLVFPWQYSDGDLLTEASNAGGLDTNRDCPRIAGYRSTTVRTTSATVGDASVILFSTACSMHDIDEEKRTQQNLSVRSGKSVAELALDVLYY